MPAEKPSDNLRPAGAPVMSLCRRGVHAIGWFFQVELECYRDVGGPSS